MRVVLSPGTVTSVQTISGSHAGALYTVGILDNGIAVNVTSTRSPGRGRGGESQLGVTAEAFSAFLGKIGISREELPGYIATLRGAEWCEFWSLVCEYAATRRP